jgi:hypothetical protein
MEDSQIASTVQRDFHDTQLENLKLENDKLKLEIQSLTSKGWADKVEKYIPVITALIAVAGFWFGVYQFYRQERTAADKFKTELTSELRRANETKELELRKPFWEKQLQLYFSASEAAATIATSKKKEARAAAEAQFWMLYWGPLAIVEDAGMTESGDAVVEQAMVNFGNCLSEAEKCNASELNQRSLLLAHKCRESVGKSWKVKLADLQGRQ